MTHPLPRVLEPEVMDTPEEAASYDAMAHRAANTAFVNRLAELGPRGHLLDIGTGPGDIPLMVCDAIADCRITAVDLSRAMLKVAAQKIAASPHARRIAVQLADAKRLPFADRSFDGVFSNTILHHIPDPRPFLAEARRVLRPGGVLLIRDLYRPADMPRLRQLVALHAAGATPHQQKMFGDSLHAALTPDELRATADAVGLSDAQVVIDTDRHMSLQIGHAAEHRSL